MAKPAQANLQNLDINLIPSGDNQGNVTILVHWLLSIGRYLIIATEVVALVIFALSVKFTIDKNDLKEAIENKKAVIDNLSADEDLFRNYQAKVDKISSLLNTHSNTYSFYSDLLTLLPAEASFDEIKLEGKKLILSGSLPNPLSLQTLISSLNNSHKFDELDITNLSVPTAQQPYYLFTASATLKPGIVQTGPGTTPGTAGGSQWSPTRVW